MGRTKLIRYESTKEDVRAIRKFLDTYDEDDTGLALDILSFFLDWQMERNCKRDAYYHHHIYSILCMIGYPPKMDEEIHRIILKQTKKKENEGGTI